MQNPEIFLTQLGLNIACAMDPLKPAAIDAAHRVSVGYETFFFADSAAMQKFLLDPTSHCGVLTDPVSFRRFRPDRQSPVSYLDDRMYVFASDSTSQLFEMMPEMYRYPNLKMLPKDSTATP